jgi:TRAP-type C4-dicarboxylate transport system substrate-binding protein
MTDKSKKNLRRRYVIGGIAAVAAAASVAGMTSTAAKAEEIVARLSFHWGPSHHAAIHAKMFAEEVNKRAKGRLRIDVYPSGQLFGIREIMGALSAGSVELGGVVGIVSFPPINKNYNLTAFPGLFKDFQQQRSFFTDTPEGREVWKNMFGRTQTKMVMYNPVGPFMSFSAESKMDTVESMKGLKARALSKSERPRWKALGADIISLPTREVYTALQTGMINTFNTVPAAIKAYSWWEYVKYGQLPYQSFADAYVIANNAWFNNLPKDLQNIILEVGKEVGDISTATIIKNSAATLEEFKQRGGVVTELNGAAKAEFDKLNKDVVIPEMAKTLVDSDVLEAAMRYTEK